MQPADFFFLKSLPDEGLEKRGESVRPSFISRVLCRPPGARGASGNPCQ
jgi:hypothetical protein